jgi:hypothetical protein
MISRRAEGDAQEPEADRPLRPRMSDLLAAAQQQVAHLPERLVAQLAGAPTELAVRVRLHEEVHGAVQAVPRHHPADQVRMTWRGPRATSI